MVLFGTLKKMYHWVVGYCWKKKLGVWEGALFSCSQQTKMTKKMRTLMRLTSFTS